MTQASKGYAPAGCSVRKNIQKPPGETKSEAQKK